MIVKFDKQYLEELYENGKSSDKRHRFQPQIVAGYIRCIDIIMSSADIETLFLFSALNYKALTGNKNGISSVRINNQYRIEFSVNKTAVEPVITICTIIDITNHYQ